MTYDTGNTAWVLASSALVLLMTPGLAFFYAGMVRSKNALSVLMQNWITMALVSVLWVICGFSIAFGPDATSGLFGNFHFVGLGNANETIPGYVDALAQSIPPYVFVVFQMMFAIITPALFTGSVAERMKFTPFIFLIAAWSLLVYAPVAHWVFSPLGWLFERGALDFAGGTVVHINAGAAGLALALVLGKRKGWPQTGAPQHNIPFLLLGAGILWFGWFGFNAGSALGANQLAGTAFVNTNTAAAVATLSWILVERFRGGKATTFGAASGAIAGLVAITPAAGFVNPVGALVIGLTAGVVCNFACSLKTRLGYDDALDVVGIHLFGGLTGALAVGFFATATVNSGIVDEGVFYGGGVDLLKEQAIAVVVVFLYSLIATGIIAKVLDLIFGGLRVPDAQEEEGLDLALHGEVAYDFGYGPGTAGGGADAAAIAAGRIEGYAEHRTGKQD